MVILGTFNVHFLLPGSDDHSDKLFEREAGELCAELFHCGQNDHHHHHHCKRHCPADTRYVRYLI